MKSVVFNMFLLMYFCVNLDINECANTPCLNGGICTDGVNTFTCTCQAGFTGAYCQTSKYQRSIGQRLIQGQSICYRPYVSMR